MESRNLPSSIINEPLYLQQQQDFQNLIINGYNPNYFIVKDLEASWGKSTLALNTLPLFKQKNPGLFINCLSWETCGAFAERNALILLSLIKGSFILYCIVSCCGTAFV